jgi:cell division protein FtsX
LVGLIFESVKHWEFFNHAGWRCLLGFIVAPIAISIAAEGWSAVVVVVVVVDAWLGPLFACRRRSIIIIGHY